MIKLSSFLRELHRTYDRVRGVFWKNGPLQGLLSGQYHRGRWRKVTLELNLKKSREQVRKYHEKFQRVGNRSKPETKCERGSKQSE